MRPGRAGHKDHVRSAVREAWASTLTTREIADTAEVSLRTVWKWTRDLPPRALGRRKWLSA